MYSRQHGMAVKWSCCLAAGQAWREGVGLLLGGAAEQVVAFGHGQGAAIKAHGGGLHEAHWRRHPPKDDAAGVGAGTKPAASMRTCTCTSDAAQSLPADARLVHAVSLPSAVALPRAGCIRGSGMDMARGLLCFGAVVLHLVDVHWPWTAVALKNYNPPLTVTPRGFSWPDASLRAYV